MTTETARWLEEACDRHLIDLPDRLRAAYGPDDR